MSGLGVSNGGVVYDYSIRGWCTDTTTAWTSLGKLDFGAGTFTGRILVERII